MSFEVQTSPEHYHSFRKSNFSSKTLLFTLVPKVLTLKKKKKQEGRGGKALNLLGRKLVPAEVLKRKEYRSLFILFILED